MPWMVVIHAPSARSACSSSPSARSVALMRERSSAAAFLVKVMASTDSMESSGAGEPPAPGSRAQTMRWVSVKVLPEPAPADTISGSSRVSTVSR